MVETINGERFNLTFWISRNGLASSSGEAAKIPGMDAPMLAMVNLSETRCDLTVVSGLGQPLIMWIRQALSPDIEFGY